MQLLVPFRPPRKVIQPSPHHHNPSPPFPAKGSRRYWTGSRAASKNGFNEAPAAILWSHRCSGGNCELNGIDFITGDSGRQETQKVNGNICSPNIFHSPPWQSGCNGPNPRECMVASPNGPLSSALVQGPPLQAIWSCTTH